MESQNLTADLLTKYLQATCKGKYYYYADYLAAATDMGVEDYTDILTFTFADGSTARLEFEEQIWVKERNERYCVEGLASLRELLDGMISDEEST